MRGGLLIWPVRSPFMGPTNKAKFYKIFVHSWVIPIVPPKNNYNQTLASITFKIVNQPEYALGL